LQRLCEIFVTPSRPWSPGYPGVQSFMAGAEEIMKAKSKRTRTTRTPVQEPRTAVPFEEGSHGRLARRGSTGVTEDRPHRRGSSDTASDPS
jgi:hypothetical protein